MAVADDKNNGVVRGDKWVPMPAWAVIAGQMSYWKPIDIVERSPHSVSSLSKNSNKRKST